MLQPMHSTFSQTILFLTKLAWSSRITLPMLVTVAFMTMNFPVQIEINVHSDPMLPHGVQLNNDDDYLSDSDSWQTIDTDEEYTDDEDDDDDEEEEYVRGEYNVI